MVNGIMELNSFSQYVELWNFTNNSGIYIYIYTYIYIYYIIIYIEIKAVIIINILLPSICPDQT